MYRTTFFFLACSALGLVASGALADPPSLDDAFSLYAELEEQGKYKEALPFAKQAVELAFKKYGQDHKATASLVYNLGILHDNLGEYELAEPLLSQALETGKRVLGPENQKTQKFEKTYKRFMAVRSLRRWTSINGKFTREARFVGLTDGIVGLRLESGSDINIALKDLSADEQETAARLQAILVDPREKGIRLPFFVEVMSDSIKLSSNVLNASDYKKIFGDVEPRTIAKEELAQSADFKQLMSYVLTHFGNEGLLRNRRDTIILFLIRPDGVDTYRAARNAVSQFEQANEKKLVLAILPNGDRMLDGLSGKEPLPAKGNLADMYALRQTTRKHVPRDPTTGHQLLQERKVLVRDGRVILYADPDKEIENAIKSRLKFLIGINDIQVGEFNYIADVKKAEQMIIDFNSDPPKNKYFDITLRKAGRRIDAQLEPTEESGEEPQDAVRGIFQTVLRDNQRKWYLNYLVEPNSFEAYIAIRKVTDSAGFFAGWQPIYPGSYTYVVFSGYQIGVKPPPPTTPPPPRRPMPIKGVLD